MSNETSSKTKHSPSCTKAFANYDLNCARCRELKAGAAPRAGWGNTKAKAEAQQLRSIKAFFAPGGRFSQMTPTQQTMCTAFEW